MYSVKFKILSPLMIFSLLFMSVGFFPERIDAATLLTAKDTMSSQALSATSTHTITYTMVSGHSFGAGDRIAFDFIEDDFTLNAISNWQTTDFSFNDGTTRTVNAVSSVSGSDPTCTAGANNVCVNINTTNSTFTVFASSSYTSSATGANVTFVINGTSSTGNGTITNKSSNVESSLLTITDSGSNTDNTTLAIAVETNDIVTVSAKVNPTLTLTINSNSVSLGTITSASAGSSSNTAQVATNAAGGFLLTYNGSTLTSAGNTIQAYGSQKSSTPGTEGFGINMVANTTPAVGASVTTNAGSCAQPVADYGTTNKYSFVAGTTTSLTAQTAPADCTYTISYVANISNITPAGDYTTPITYVATGTF